MLPVQVLGQRLSLGRAPPFQGTRTQALSLPLHVQPGVLAVRVWSEQLQTRLRAREVPASRIPFSSLDVISTYLLLLIQT